MEQKEVMASETSAQCFCGAIVNVENLEDHVTGSGDNEGCEHATNFERTTTVDGAMFYRFTEVDTEEKMTTVSFLISHLREEGLKSYLACSHCSFKAEVCDDDENIDSCPSCGSELLLKPDNENIMLNLDKDEETLSAIFSDGTTTHKGAIETESGKEIVSVDLGKNLQ